MVTSTDKSEEEIKKHSTIKQSPVERLLQSDKFQKTVFVNGPTYKFDDKSFKWQEFKKDSIDIVQKKEISFITYNVWFSPHNFDNRIRAIGKIFEKYSPDFICIQEATQKFLMYL